MIDSYWFLPAAITNVECEICHQGIIDVGTAGCSNPICEMAWEPWDYVNGPPPGWLPSWKRGLWA